ncbi:HalOD1 output domain-containing protein [Haloarcula litorea]|uniref:HalOD1 output domain-containing protein n=1 Tax=Haloarcula litorea TaxID=3032579 RepID=UPI0023E801D3|nr:HalOD1 output domain-containing protein [Halomicroarcula sp. GDY20]
MTPATDTAPDSPLVSVTADPSEPLAATIVRAVAAVDDERIAALPPLTESVDPDAVDALFSSDASGHVAFTYSGHRVVVDADGGVAVY